MSPRALGTLVMLFGINVALWLLAWSVSLPLSDDLVMIDIATASRARPSGGPEVIFDLETCSHCPPYILVGRELGNPGDVTYMFLAFINAPAILLAKGAHLGLGIHELKPWWLLSGLVTQWVSFGLLWYAWTRSRSQPPGHELSSLERPDNNEMKPTKRRPGRASRLISVLSGRRWPRA